jgi:urea transport system ATP-binding protein
MSAELESINNADFGDATGLVHVKAPGEVDVRHGIILYVEDVSVSFEGFKALNKLSLAIHDGELRCVIGPNGAGKTTMMDVITGKTKPDSGQVFLGQTINLLHLDEPRIARCGVGRKFQKPTVFERHMVWENLDLARQSDKRWFRSLTDRITEEAWAKIQETLHLIGLSDFAYKAAGELSHGQKQFLEIGMLLMQHPRLLLLDEPAAGMSDRETERLAELLDHLRGLCSMMVVEHDMAFVAAMSGANGIVTVMAEGTVIAEGTLEQVKQNERVIESYLGR